MFAWCHGLCIGGVSHRGTVVMLAAAVHGRMLAFAVFLLSVVVCGTACGYVHVMSGPVELDQTACVLSGHRGEPCGEV